MASEIQQRGSSLGEDMKHAGLLSWSGPHLPAIDDPGTFSNIDVPGSSRSKMGVDANLVSLPRWGSLFSGVAETDIAEIDIPTYLLERIFSEPVDISETEIPTYLLERIFSEPVDISDIQIPTYLLEPVDISETDIEIPTYLLESGISETDIEIPTYLLEPGISETDIEIPTYLLEPMDICCQESGVWKEPMFSELGTSIVQTECRTEPLVCEIGQPAASSTKPEKLGATVDMIPKPLIYEIHNSGTYWTQVDGVIADPHTEVPMEDVERRVFYFEMDHPLPLPTMSVWHEGWEWGCRPRKYQCATCNNLLSEHDTDACPFMALATQFDVDFVTGLPPAIKTASSTPTLRKRKKRAASSSLCMAYFPPVLSRAERTAANLMRRMELNLVRISNHLPSSKRRELKELFKRFGRVTHSFIGYPGGNGFVNFVRRVDALRAIKKMNGYEFEGLKLRVVWAYFDSNREDML